MYVNKCESRTWERLGITHIKAISDYSTQKKQYMTMIIKKIGMEH